MERIKDYLLMEQEFIQNQENIKPHTEKSAVRSRNMFCLSVFVMDKFPT